jgi:tetratricopeptide (TPR) repeat protein
MRLLLFCSFLWAACVAIFAADLPAFETANRLYEQGKFPDAIAAYQKILSEKGGSAPLYFNLGNAFFKNGQIGKAIYSYRMAELLDPRDPDVRANLRFARNTVAGTSSSPLARDWMQYLTLKEWTGIAAGFIWLWFGLLFLREVKPNLVPALRGYTATAGGAALLGVVLLSFALYVRYSQPQAIVIVRESVVRLGPLEESQSAFTARDGSELTITDQNADWLQVRDSSRHVGWVLKKSVLVFPPKS